MIALSFLFEWNIDVRIKFLRGFDNYKESMDKIGKLLDLPDDIVVETVDLKKYHVDTALPKHKKYLISQSTESVVSCEYVGKLPIQGLVVIGVKCTTVNDGHGRMWFVEISNEKYLNKILNGEYNDI